MPATASSSPSCCAGLRQSLLQGWRQGVPLHPSPFRQMAARAGATPHELLRTCAALQREGADLVFAMIDGGRDGIAQACRETPMRQIGNVLDWVARDPQVFAASAIADSGQGVERAIADFVDGTLRPGTLTRTGLEAPQAVRLVMTPALQQAHGAEIDAWSQRLQSGALVPDETYDGPELQA